MQHVCYYTRTNCFRIGIGHYTPCLRINRATVIFSVTSTIIDILFIILPPANAAWYYMRSGLSVSVSLRVFVYPVRALTFK